MKLRSYETHAHMCNFFVSVHTSSGNLASEVIEAGGPPSSSYVVGAFAEAFSLQRLFSSHSVRD